MRAPRAHGCGDCSRFPSTCISWLMMPLPPPKGARATRLGLSCIVRRMLTCNCAGYFRNPRRIQLM
jgi:hypothetical protein